MRRLGYALLALLLLLALAFLASLVWARWEAWRSLAPLRGAGLGERVLFEPLGDLPLEFSVATHEGWIALEGFVVAPPARRARELPLTLDIGLLGRRGTEYSRRYLALPPVADAQPYGLLDGAPEQAAWILPSVWIDLRTRPDVRAVSVRVRPAGDGVERVLWRAALDERLSDREVNLRYRRLGPVAREALTATWITPAGLVDPKVKQELLRFRRQRVAPRGQPGDAFVARSVLRQPADDARRRYNPRDGALAIYPPLAVSLLLDTTQRVVVDARRVDDAPMQVDVDGPSGRITVASRWQGEWAPGLYVLRSSERGSVDVRDASTGESLLPAGQRPRTHRARADRSLSYALVPLDGAPPPVRLRLRPEGQAAIVALRFLNAEGAQVQSRELAVTARASAFDRLASALGRSVAEPVQIDLLPPADARTLVVAADAPVLVHALTTLSARRPGRRWYSFEPTLDPDSVLVKGIVVVEQPRPASAPGPTAIPGGDASKTALPRLARRNEGRTSDRPKLRLRPVRDVPSEATDED